MKSKTKAYLKTIIVFLFIFFVGIIIYTFLNNKESSAGNVGQSHENYDRNKYFNGDSYPNKDTLKSDNEKLEITYTLTPLDSVLKHSDTRIVGSNGDLYCKILVTHSEDFEIGKEALNDLETCFRVTANHPLDWKVSVVPLKKRGEIIIAAKFLFYLDSDCKTPYDHPYIHVPTTVYLDDLTFGAKLTTLGEKMGKVVIDNFLLFWTSFVGVCFSFVISKIKKKFNVNN